MASTSVDHGCTAMTAATTKASVARMTVSVVRMKERRIGRGEMSEGRWCQKREWNMDIGRSCAGSVES